MTKSREELINLLKSNIDSFNLYRKETNHEKIDLSGSDLEGTNLCRADLENCNLKDTLMGFAYLHSANLKNCDFTDLTIGRADMTESDLSGSILNGADLANSILYGANMTGIQARNTMFQGAKLREINLSNADLTNANLADLDLNGVNFENTILNGAEFTASNLSSAINLNKAKFDSNTCWPEASKLPEGFDPTQIAGEEPEEVEFIEEDFNTFNTDIGPGIETEQEYEFLDTPQQSQEEAIPEAPAETELRSLFDRPEEPEDLPPTPEQPETDEYADFDEPPSFEQFTADQFQDYPAEEAPASEEIPEQIEPGLAAMPMEEYEEEAPEEVESEDDPFLSSLSDSFESMSQSVSNGERKLGGIQEQDFPLGLNGSSFEPAADLQAPETPQAPEATMPTPVALQAGTAPQPDVLPAAAMNTEQMQTIMDSLNVITEKLGSIEKEQQEQKEVINELKQTVATQASATETKPQTASLHEETKTTIERLESKVDILAQTDPIDQIDSIIGDLEESLKTDQENIEERLSEIIETIEKVTTAAQESTPLEKESIDLDTTELTANIHQMLANLESNIREDQDKADKKIDDLSTIVESLSVAIENSPADVIKESSIKLESFKEESLQKLDALKEALTEDSTQKLNILKETIQEDSTQKLNTLKETIQEESTQKTENIQKYLTQVDQGVEAVRDNVVNINNTLGALVELSQDENAESQIYEAFYDFEFRLQLELEKNQNRLSDLEKLLETTNTSIEKVSDKSEQLEILGELAELPKMLETFRNQIFNEIQQTEQRTDRIKEMVDDMIIQLESVFNMQLENFERSIGMEISNLSDKMEEFADIKDKIDEFISSSADETTALDPEINEKINSIDENITSIFEHIATTHSDLTDTKNQLTNNYQQIAAISQQVGKGNELILTSTEHISHTKEYLASTNNNISAINDKLISMDEVLSGLKVSIADQKTSSSSEEVQAVIEHLMVQINEYSGTSKNFNQEISNKVTSLENNLQNTLGEMDQKIIKINSMIRNVYKALDSITDLITDISKPAPTSRATTSQERPIKKGLLSKPKAKEPIQTPTGSSSN